MKLQDIKLENIKVWQLVAILGGIIIATPLLFKITAFIPFLDFSESGQIGDTLGGITSPFINSIAAILVFVAFKAQIEANNLQSKAYKLTIEQKYIDQINVQIQRLEDNFLNVQGDNNEIDINLEYVHSNNNYSVLNNSLIAKNVYTLILFVQTLDLIEELSNQKQYFNSKVGIIYYSLYVEKLNVLESIILKYQGKINDRYYISYSEQYIEILKRLKHKLELISV